MVNMRTFSKVQANLVILPGKYAEQFRDFCSSWLGGRGSKGPEASRRDVKGRD